MDEEIRDEETSEEFRMVMRLIALQLKHAIEADSDEERVKILVDLKQELEKAGMQKDG